MLPALLLLPPALSAAQPPPPHIARTSSRLHVGLPHAGARSAPAPHHSQSAASGVDTSEPDAPSLYRRCVNEAVGGTHRAVCYWSLATLLDYPTPPPGTPDSYVSTGLEFDSRDRARERCREMVPGADLAAPSTPQRNHAASAVVEAVGEPHWIAADNPPAAQAGWLGTSEGRQDSAHVAESGGATVTWLSEATPSAGHFLPWDSSSGQ